MADQSGFKPHDLASAQIDGWRGRCLESFARAERAVGQTLEAAVGLGRQVKLKHLAGQRLADLSVLAEACGGTAKQVAALRSAVEGWQSVESRRAFFAHGISTALLDKHGRWHVVLDFSVYRGNKPAAERWTLTQLEAQDFEERLLSAFADLSRELGQLRKRLAA